MLAHHMKAVLTQVPEAMEFVKKASLEQDFPLDNKDSVSASYLTAHYLLKTAGKVLDPTMLSKLEKAASLYGVKDELDKYVPRFTPMVKQASEEDVSKMVKQAEAMFDGEMCGFLNLQEASEAADSLMEKFASDITSENVLRYSGHAYMNKEAAITTLANRYHATKGERPEFVKIARIINDSVRDDDFKTVHDICKTVTLLDKKAGLDIMGFNFYKEALIVKKAAYAGGLSVKVDGQDVPYSKIQALGKERIGSFLGKDIGASLTEDPVNDKAVIESLPLDSQKMLASILKSV
jgi:hypothetical protein